MGQWVVFGQERPLFYAISWTTSWEVNTQLITMFAFNHPPTYIPFETFDLERPHADSEISKHMAWQHPHVRVSSRFILQREGVQASNASQCSWKVVNSVRDNASTTTSWESNGSEHNTLDQIDVLHNQTLSHTIFGLSSYRCRLFLFFMYKNHGLISRCS